MPTRTPLGAEGALGIVKEFTPADTGIDGADISDADTYSSAVMLVDGFCAFNVALKVDNDGGSDATTGAFEFQITAYAHDGTVVIDGLSIAAQNSVLSHGRTFTCAWVEGDVGSGEHMTSYACKPLVALHSFKIDVVVSSGFDNGPWTGKLYVFASR